MTKKRNIMEEFSMSEISGVDRPAQVGARVSIMKRAPDVAKRLRLLSESEGHTHLIDDSEDGGTTSHDRKPGEEMWHSHPWVRNDDGTLTVGTADGHSHNVVLKNQPGQAETNMTDTNKPAGEPAVTKAQLEAAQAELQLAKAYGGLNDAEKAYASRLAEGSERNAFITKSAPDREALVQKATAADPVVYTCLDGSEIRKSAGDALINLAKRADASERQLVAERAARTQERLEKRAGDQLGNLPGDAVAKVALLRAVEGISDEPVRKQVDELLKAANDRGSAAFRSIGTAAKSADLSDAETKLAEMAQSRATAKGEDFHKAYAEVLKTPEGRNLYAQTRQ